MGLDHIMRRYVREDEVYDVLHACHNELSRGNYAAKRTTYKLLQVGYYQTTMFKDANQYVYRGDDYQRMVNPSKPPSDRGNI